MKVWDVASGPDGNGDARCRDGGEAGDGGRKEGRGKESREGMGGREYMY